MHAGRSCPLRHYDTQVMEAFLRYADTEPGETSEDGDFTVIEAECLAGCGFPTWKTPPCH